MTESYDMDVDRVLEGILSGFNRAQIQQRYNITPVKYRTVINSEAFKKAYKEHNKIITDTIVTERKRVVQELMSGIRSLIPDILEAYRKGLQSQDHGLRIGVVEKLLDRFAVTPGSLDNNIPISDPDTPKLGMQSLPSGTQGQTVMRAFEIAIGDLYGHKPMALSPENVIEGSIVEENEQ